MSKKKPPGLREILSKEEQDRCHDYYRKNSFFSEDGTINEEKMKKFTKEMKELLLFLRNRNK